MAMADSFIISKSAQLTEYFPHVYFYWHFRWMQNMSLCCLLLLLVELKITAHMKARLSSLDLRALSNELDVRLRGKFVQNFYATAQRFMYVKFSNKDTLLLEPGVCAHLTNVYGTEISHFCKKLREKCRHARVSRIYQHSFDRILVIDISRFKIVVEFFSGGNILIVDSSDNIVDLLRPVPEVGITKGTVYVWNTVVLDLSFDRFVSLGLEGMLPFEKEYIAVITKELESRFGPLSALTDEKFREDLDHYLGELEARITSMGCFGELTVGKNGAFDQLYAFPTASQDLVYKLEHSVIPITPYQNGEAANCTTTAEMPTTPQLEAISLATTCMPEPHITSKDKLATIAQIRTFEKEEISDLIKRNKKITAIHFPTINEAIEQAFADRKKTQKTKTPKADRIRQAQDRYIKELEIQAEAYANMATIIEDNRNFVSEILEIFKKLYESKMKWSLFDSFWEEEKRKGNKHSLAIKSYDLERKTAIVAIEDATIELALNEPLNNSLRNIHDKKRKALDKAAKTRSAMEFLIEKATPKGIKVAAQKRIPYWFERYNWFISTDGILVIGGKSAQDNEQLVKTRLEKDNLYFHCDVQGASSIIVKGRSELSIAEAAYSALVLSRCWTEGVIKRVFYVEATQVSKTAPSGEFLSKGGFAITGKKTFLDPYKLEYGIGLLFKEKDTQPLEFKSNPENKLVHALPVCAPWSVIKHYKYRARLCPGNDKKSAIAHAVQNSFNQLSENSAEELIVKAVGIDEYINVLIGKSKLAKITK